MLEKTRKIRAQIQQSKDVCKQLSFLQNQYQGETVYVVSCGPSLSKCDADLLKEKLKDKLVICVKQAIEFFPDITDFHLYNYINFIPYEYKKDNVPIKIELNNTRKIVSKSSDIKLPIDFPMAASPNRYKLSVANTRRWDHYLMSKTPVRPFGPGIVYEMVGYLAIHLAVSKIITIGWDCADPGTHYYGEDQISKERRKVLQKEMDFVVDGMGKFSEWLQSHNVGLEIISDINPAPKQIKRLTVEEL